MHMAGWMGGGWVMMIFWWVVVIVGIFLLVNFLSHNKTQPRIGDSALEVLKKRYVAGEISEEEFDRMKKEILNT